MPAKSKEQHRLFGWVHAVQKGEAKDAPKKIKDIAKSISKEDAEDFAETKHKGLPEKVKHKKKTNESVMRITENDINHMVHTCIKEVMENWEQGVTTRNAQRETFSSLKSALRNSLNRCGWEVVDIFKNEGKYFTVAVLPQEDASRVAEIALAASAAADALGKRISPISLKSNEKTPQTGVHFLRIEM